MTEWPSWMDEFPMEFWTDAEVAAYIKFAHAVWKRRRGAGYITIDVPYSSSVADDRES